MFVPLANDMGYAKRITFSSPHSTLLPRNIHVHVIFEDEEKRRLLNINLVWNKGIASSDADRKYDIIKLNSAQTKRLVAVTVAQMTAGKRGRTGTSHWW